VSASLSIFVVLCLDVTLIAAEEFFIVQVAA